MPGARNADAIIVPRHGRKVKSRQQQILGAARLAQEKERRILRVAEINPFEAVGRKVAFVQRRFGFGWTINFGNRVAVITCVGLTLAVVAVSTFLPLILR